MDHITQLKKIRAEAIARLRNSPDFRLAGKLGQLIVELGDTVEDVRIFDDASLTSPIAPVAAVAAVAAAVEEKPRTFESAFTKPAVAPVVELDSDDQEAEEMIDELVAEIEGDAAELDALMAETKDKPTLGSISSYFNTEKTEKSLSNGAAH
ncbi:MAG: hypothetical protein ABJH63_11105 [Rhizobiaceae bacterium]